MALYFASEAAQGRPQLVIFLVFPSRRRNDSSSFKHQVHTYIPRQAAGGAGTEILLGDPLSCLIGHNWAPWLPERLGKYFYYLAYTVGDW